MADYFPNVEGVLRYFSLSHGLDSIKLAWLQAKYFVTSEKITKVAMLKVGDHICYPFFGLLYHHAIVKRVIDDKTVEIIHLSGSSTEVSTIKIRKDKENLSSLASQGKLYRMNYGKCSSTGEVIARAERKIGQPGLGHRCYNVLTNNCEHFATWCKTGEAFCFQNAYVRHGENDDAMLPL